MEILSICCIRRNGTDHLLLTTDLPSGLWPYRGNEIVEMKLAAGTAEEYCEIHFKGAPLKIVEDK